MIEEETPIPGNKTISSTSSTPYIDRSSDHYTIDTPESPSSINSSEKSYEQMEFDFDKGTTLHHDDASSYKSSTFERYERSFEQMEVDFNESSDGKKDGVEPKINENFKFNLDDFKDK